MRKFKFEQTNSTPYRGLDGSVIFFDGTDSTHKILVESVEGLDTAPMAMQTQQSPYQVGITPIRPVFGSRTISMECAIVIDANNTAGRAAMESIRRDLLKKLSPAGMGYVPDSSATGAQFSTVTGKLSYAYDGVNYDRFIDCVPMNLIFPNRRFSDGFQRFRISFFCPDPTWYGATQSASFAAVPALPSIGTVYGVAWSSSLQLMVAVGTSGVMTSPDGIVWTSRTAPSKVWRAVAEYNGTFVVVGGISGTLSDTIITSTNGIDWTSYTITASELVTVVYSTVASLWIAHGPSVSYTSSNGSSWSSGVVTSNQVIDCPELGFVIAVDSTVAKKSTNGTSWTNYTLPVSSTAYGDITWSPVLSRFVAVSPSPGSSAYSSDGEVWTSVAIEADTVAWSNELLLFVTTKNVLTGGSQYSSDGITWSTGASLQLGSYYQTIYVQELHAFVTVGLINSSSGRALSYNGTAWQFVAGQDQYVIISNDGDLPCDFSLSLNVDAGTPNATVTLMDTEVLTIVENQVYIIGANSSVIIGDGMLWDGDGSLPGDHILEVNAVGLSQGIVQVNTAFNQKDIRQFGRSILTQYKSGNFFNLYNGSNTLYLRNAKTGSTVTWRNRYLGV